MLVVELLIGLPPAATPDEFSGVQLKKSARARPEWLEWQVGMGIQGGGGKGPPCSSAPRIPGLNRFDNLCHRLLSQ